MVASEGDSVWDAATAEGVELPATCLQGWCLTCAGRLLAGEVDQSESLRYYEADREAGFALLCTAHPLTPLKVLTHQKEAMQHHRIEKGLPAPRG